MKKMSGWRIVFRKGIIPESLSFFSSSMCSHSIPYSLNFFQCSEVVTRKTGQQCQTSPRAIIFNILDIQSFANVFDLEASIHKF